MKIPNEIEKAIENDKLVVFVGAGLSKRFKLPDWNTMVIDVIEEIGNEDYKPMIALIKSKTFSALDVLEKIKSERMYVNRYIKKEFNIQKNNYKTHKSILEFSGKVVTTNYDNAFENASNGKIIPTVYTSGFNVSEIHKNEEKYIFKLHGTFSEPDNCIVFKEDYENLYGEASAATEKLKTIFAEKTILFLGFSFSDVEINLIFKKLDTIFDNNNKHYIVTKQPQGFKQFKFLSPIEIKEHNEIDMFVAKCLQFKNGTTEVLEEKMVLSIKDEIDSIEITKTEFKNSLNQISSPTNLFTGRNDKLADVENAYQNNEVFSITGIGGIGKTQLTLKFLESLDSEQRGNITWQEFIESTHFDNFIIASGFGIIIQSNKTELEKFSAFVDKLNEYKRIVVWENFHDNTDAAFLRFLAFSSGKLVASKIIIVSRATDNIDAHKNISLIDFKESEIYTKTLLEKRYEELTLSDDDITKICDYVKGHPLAIELTLNLCRSMSLKKVLGKLSKYKLRNDKLSQRLFEDILAQDATTSEEKEFLYQFSIFKERISEKALTAIFGEDCFYNILPSLKGKFLIDYIAPYYETHPLIREFCYEKLNNKKELHKTAATWFIDQREDTLNTLLEERIFYHLKGAEEYQTIKETIERYGEDYVNQAVFEPLLEMITFLEEKKIDSDLFWIFKGDIFKIKSDWEDALACYQKVDQSNKKTQNSVQARLKVAMILQKQSKFNEAMDMYTEIEKIAKEEGFEKYIAWVYNNIASIKEQFGKYNEVLELFKKALVISKRLGIKEDIATLYNNLGSIFNRKGFKNYSPKKALEYYQESLKVGLEIGEKMILAFSYHNIGTVYQNEDFENFNTEKALDNHTKSLEIKKEIGDKSGMSNSYNGMGRLYTMADFKYFNLEKALGYYTNSLNIRKEIGDKHSKAESYNNIASIYSDKKNKQYNPNKALEYYKKSIGIIEEFGTTINIIICYENISILQLDHLKNLKDAFLNIFIAHALAKQMRLKSTIERLIQRINHYKENMSSADFKKYANEAYNELKPKYKKEIILSDFLGEPRKSIKEPGRNEIVTVVYKSGEQKEGKYKKFKLDVDKGLCDLVEL